jgi:uncharacterized protein
MKVILIPGMGCTPVASSNWYAWFRDEMLQRKNVQCELHEFPDPYKCRESIWMPFVKALMEDPADTILVGHSSGAACAMRLLEECGGGDVTATPLAACILVAAAYTDLGDDDERESEYFNRTWNWNQMAQGASRIVLFHGTDDHLIPVAEARHIAAQLGDSVDYRERNGPSHFFRPWRELLAVMDEVLRAE